LVLITGAAVVQGLAHYNVGIFSDQDLARDAYTGAYVSMGLGIVLSLVGILYNPAIVFQ
jgi:hypothetical protein